MTGLVGWWPLHENSGSTARDLSGNGNHGTLKNGVTKGVAGKGGLTGYSFDGTEDFVEISSGKVLQPSQGPRFTISAWVYNRSLSSTNPYVARSGDGDNKDWAQLLYDQNDDSFRLSILDDSVSSNYNVSAYSSIAPEADRWYHLVGVKAWDGSESTLELWIDGELDKQVTDSNSLDGQSDTTSPLSLGHNNYSNYQDGLISDVRVYNRALSPQEIQTLHEWGEGDYTDRSYHDGSDSGAVSRWKFNGDVTDSWGSKDGSNKGISFVNDSIRGKSAAFDPANSEYVEVGRVSDIFDLSSGTMSWWGYVNSSFSGIDKFFEHFSGSNDRIYSDYRDSNNGGNFIFALGDTGVSVSDRPTDSWMFWTAAWDGSTVRIYRNGVVVKKASYSYESFGDESFDIGRRNGNNDQYLDGKIDDLRVYSRPLEPSEVFQLYQWGTRGRDMRKLTVNKR